VKKFTINRQRSLLKGSAATLLATFAMGVGVSGAYAQDADTDEEVEEVVVTGSRIPRKDLVANSPVSVVGIEEIRLTTNVEADRLLDALPQTVSTNGPTTNNPGNGAANVNLRGLGTVRTLVLVNGRRFVGESTSGVVDLNNIPTSLIQRAEVVTGGASAVYGSDALAGVVNFILKDDFEGLEISSQYGTTQEGDSDRFNVDLTLGTNFDDGRGNVVINASYFNREQTFAGARDFAAVQFAEDTDANGNPIFVPGGSTTIPQGRFNSNTLDENGVLDSFGNPIGSGGVIVTSDGLAQAFRDPEDRFNFSPFNNLQLPLERWTLSALGTYQVTDGIELFFEGTFANNRINRTLAPTPFSEGGFQLDLRNPFIPQALVDVFSQIDDDGDSIVSTGVRRRTLEAGNRVSADNRNLYRFVTGFRGDLGDSASWEVFYNFGRSEETQRQEGNIVISRFQQGLLVDPDNPTQCANPANGCVVLNPFGEGNLTQEQIDFITVGATNTTFIQQQQAGAYLSGTAYELPAGPLGYSVGLEYRKESAANQPDTFLATGDIDGFNAGLPTNGSFDVKEIFVETVVPILSGVAGAEYLGIEAGIRFSDYSTAGGVTSYKIGGEWNPVEDLKLRALYQRAVRAPNVNELFLGQSNAFPGGLDFCDLDASPTAAEQAFCVQLGVPQAGIATFQQDNAQIEVLNGGNPDLFEETSDTYTVGFVYTPSQIPGLTFIADYYDITVDDAISTFGGGLQSTIDACRITLDINDPFCQVLTARDPSGQLEEVPQFNQNIASIATSGIDVSAAYAFDAFGGEFRITSAATHVISFERQGSPIVQVDECAGVVGVRTTCGRANPEFRVTSRVSYSIDELTVSLRHRYLSSVEDERLAFGTSTAAQLLVPVIGDQNIFDFTFNYQLRENLSIFGNINNLFDNDPPIFGRGANGQFNTDSGTYDVLGRRFTVGFRANF
jgi:outer membrane receptor protein involved in Fe transport